METMMIQCIISRIKSWGRGSYMGEDLFGNRYYQNTHHKRYGRSVRSVQYKGWRESSLIPPGWHAWLHYKRDDFPIKENTAEYSWQKHHLPNLTGTPYANRRSQTQRPAYEAWHPEYIESENKK